MNLRLADAINSLEPMIGTWKVTISVPLMAAYVGRVVFEPIVNGAFVLMKTTIDGDGPPDSICMFGGDQDERFVQMLYNDDRGISRVYASVFNGRRWEMWRRTNESSERFLGVVSANGDAIEASWEASKDGHEWHLESNMKFERVLESEQAVAT